MSQVRDVSGTAFVVAEFRAEENQAVEPLYRDPVVGLFLNDDSRYAADLIAARFPPVKDMVKVRTRYFDDMLDQQLLSHVPQVVILGAGLDTRAVRKGATAVRYFEIDDPATLALKQAGYKRNDIHPNVNFIPGNYLTDGLIELLRQNDFDFDLPTYVIWEGNTMYLPSDSINHVISELKRHVRRFRLSFDYMADTVIANTTGHAEITILVESFAAMGAPWISGFRDIDSFGREQALDVIENFKLQELSDRYQLRRPLTSPIFRFYSVCTLDSRR
jgi:methyltransferase (TIGR00027 family)